MTKAAQLGATAVMALAIVVAAAMLAAPLAGFERYVITGDSMAGPYPRGTLLFSERVATSDLRVGDVITYDPPPGRGPAGLVTHRIVTLRERGGEPLLRTKGDANAHADPWRFSLDGAEQARAAIGVPYAGFALAALGIRWVRMLVIGVPAAVLALVLLARLWRDVAIEPRGEAEATR